MNRLRITDGVIKMLDVEGNPHQLSKLEGEFVLVPIEACACLAKVRSDEPIFVLRGQDWSGPSVIQTWAARNARTSPPVKLDSALRRADDFRRWQRENPKLVKYPD